MTCVYEPNVLKLFLTLLIKRKNIYYLIEINICLNFGVGCLGKQKRFGFQARPKFFELGNLTREESLLVWMTAWLQDNINSVPYVSSTSKNEDEM